MVDRDIYPIFTKNLKSISMEKLLRLTSTKGDTILIGVQSIISVEEHTTTDIQGKKTNCRKIDSVGAMISRNYVTESAEEIYQQYKNN